LRFPITTQEQLSKEIKAIVKEHNEKQIKINWQFSIEGARKKMNAAYTNVNSLNEKYKQT
jgi:hypothetical protein